VLQTLVKSSSALIVRGSITSGINVFMTARRMDELRLGLQQVMLRAGARLPSLDGAQIRVGKRNNSIEGKKYSLTKGESENMKAQQTQENKDSNDSEITPAGGQTDADLLRDFAAALKRPGTVVHVKPPLSNGQLALMVAVPTVVLAAGVVGLNLALMAIDNKWGNGARANRLIDAGIERISVKTDGVGEASVGVM
jgi:hypothetical protein